MGSQVIAPLLYKGTMTAELFTTWYQEQLLPLLSQPHLIVMDNASFHPKKQLDEISLAQGHYFLPLPPYSPELNPIEQSWATLKRNVTELARTFGSVLNAVEYYFKTK
ncbi:transposase [Streptococcus suis]|uniref:transposase n=1 Tax=Streptococcus suis TaxID=1307 RepID=UPI0039088C57